jgi:hypothetical protein
MKDEVRIHAKAAILEILNGASAETNLGDLLDDLHQRGIEDDVTAKAAIWQLVAQGEIELTPKRTLRIAGRYRKEFALAT